MKRLSIWAGILFILSALFSGCSDDDQALPLQLRTSVVTDITETSATLGGKVEGVLDGVAETGICWSVQPEAEVQYVPSSSVSAEFTVSLTGLRSGTRYFARSYAKRGNEVVLGDLRNFTCQGQLAMVLPFNERFRGDVFPPQYWNIIDKDGDGYNWEAYNNRFFAALSDSYRSKQDLTPENYLVTPKITVSAGKPVLKWSVGVMDDEFYMEHYKVVISETPFTEENCQTNGTVLFEESLPAEAYRTLLYRSVSLDSYKDKDVYIAWVHYRSTGLYCMYVTDIQIEGEGAALNVTIPQVVMGELENLSRTSVDVKADIPEDGGASVIRKGFCFGTAPSPTIDNRVETVDPHQTLAVTLKDLQPGATYYVRAFAENSAGLSYSEEQKFSTPEVIMTTLLNEPLTGEVPASWTVIDKDGDGHGWEYYEGYGTVCSDSYLSAEGALTPENYLVTPTISIPEDANSADISFEMAASAKNAYKEKYKVVVSLQPITIDNCRDAETLKEYTELTEEYKQKNFVNQTIDLSAYIGKTVYIGFVHGDCTDMESLLLKNVIINSYE